MIDTIPLEVLGALYAAPVYRKLLEAVAAHERGIQPLGGTIVRGESGGLFWCPLSWRHCPERSPAECFRAGRGEWAWLGEPTGWTEHLWVRAIGNRVRHVVGETALPQYPMEWVDVAEWSARSPTWAPRLREIHRHDLVAYWHGLGRPGGAA